MSVHFGSAGPSSPVLSGSVRVRVCVRRSVSAPCPPARVRLIAPCPLRRSVRRSAGLRLVSRPPRPGPTRRVRLGLRAGAPPPINTCWGRPITCSQPDRGVPADTERLADSSGAAHGTCLLSRAAETVPEFRVDDIRQGRSSTSEANL